MSDNFLDKLLGGEGAKPPGHDGNTVADESYVPMLDLVLASGNRVALPYSMLFKVELDPSAGMTLHYSSDTVHVAGYRLEPLYHRIARHRLAELRAEGDRAGLSDDGRSPVVTALRCEGAS